MKIILKYVHIIYSDLEFYLMKIIQVKSILYNVTPVLFLITWQNCMWSVRTMTVNTNYMNSPSPN